MSTLAPHKVHNYDIAIHAHFKDVAANTAPECIDVAIVNNGSANNIYTVHCMASLQTIVQVCHGKPGSCIAPSFGLLVYLTPYEQKYVSTS